MPGLAPQLGDIGRGKRLFVGMSALYLALYLHYGFFTFIPLWLKDVGSTPEEIGVLLAIPLAVRLLTVAPFAAWAGRHGRVRDCIVVTALLSAALISLLMLEPGHGGRVAIVIVFAIMWDQLPVLTDAYAVMAVRSRGLDFGRMRVWGSIAVVISTATGGWVFDVIGIGALPWVVALLLLLPAALAPRLPQDRRLAIQEQEAGGTWRSVLRDGQLLCAMIAAALIMGSHGVLTSFAAIQWTEQGISTSMVGLLQALAVSAEILAFVVGAKLLGHRDPRWLIGIAAAAASLRWIIMAQSPAFGVLIAAQLLHSITSTGAILGIMLLIAARVPMQTSAAAQGIYAVLVGIAMASTTAGSGVLWSYGTQTAYLSMAALALLAIPFTFARQRVDRAGNQP